MYAVIAPNGKTVAILSSRERAVIYALRKGLKTGRLYTIQPFDGNLTVKRS